MKNKKFLVVFIVLISMIVVVGLVREQSIKYYEESNNKTQTHMEHAGPVEPPK